MVLFNVCKDQNPQTFFISRVDEIDFSWFESDNTVGICGATSTPMWLMEDVQKALQSK
jgi:4-hydroxy-3-methylbut-2-enyl diphosphate reductase